MRIARQFVFFAVILCLAACVWSVRSSAAPNSFAKKRVVTLVFDDSGSMAGYNDGTGRTVPLDNWKYANYSLQTLAGLLSPDDKLRVINMSVPGEVVEIRLASDNRQRAIDEIRNWNIELSTGTPFKTVRTAIASLEKEAQGKPDAEYWLVVLTDGVFSDFQPSEAQNSDPKRNLELAAKELAAYRQAMESYQATAKSVLLTIETAALAANQELTDTMTAFKKIWQDTLDGTVIESKGTQDIIVRMQEVAALMTNRDPAGNPKQSVKPIYSGDTVQFNSLFPMRRLTLLEQAVQDPQQSTATANPGKLTVDQSDKTSAAMRFDIATPVDPYELNPPIFSSITHYESSSAEGSLPEGTYRIELQDAENRKDRLQFLVEPAFDYKLEVLKRNEDGTDSRQEDEFYFGSRMAAVVRLLRSDTADEPLALTSSARQLLSITGTLNGQQLLYRWDEQQQAYIAEFDMPEASPNELTAKVHVPGFYLKERTISFMGVTPRVFGMVSALTEWSARVNQLSHAAPLKFLVTANGEPIGSEELAKLMPSLKIDTNGKKINFDVKQNGNVIELTPRRHWHVWFTDTGEIPVTLTINGTYPDEQATVRYIATILDISWWDKYGEALVYSAIVLIAGWWIIRVVRKSKFYRQAFMEVNMHNLINGRRIGGYQSTEPFRYSRVSRYLIPSRAESSMIQELSFKAGSKPDHIILPKESQIEGMKVADEVLEEAGLRDIRIYSNEEVIVRNNHMETIYKYIAG